MSFDERLLIGLAAPLMAYAWVLKRDADRASDLVQTTFLRALERRHQFAEGTDLRAWLFAIAHNLHIDSVKRAIRDAEYARERTKLATMEPAEQHVAKVQMHQVMRALAKLSREQRQVISLVAIKEMSYQTAAALIGVPVGTVRSRLARGRSELWRVVNGFGRDAGARMERPKQRTGRGAPIPSELRGAAIHALNHSTSISEAAKKLREAMPSSTMPRSTLRKLAIGEGFETRRGVLDRRDRTRIGAG
jgi:RNA polymerase sigma-70 factor (ECF subfamily)